MRFKCLVMDHDDTTVNSTATIHFPSFLAYLKLVRPEASYTLEEYFRKNFDPGIMALFTGELGFSEEEIEGEFRFWQDWVRTRIPVAYPGIREILQRHKEAGGRIAVVSHSMRENIERDYQGKRSAGAGCHLRLGAAARAAQAAYMAAGADYGALQPCAAGTSCR